MSIKKKIIVAFISIATIPVILLSLFLLKQTRQSSLDSFYLSTEGAFKQIDNGFTLYIGGLRNSVKFVAEAPLVRKIKDNVPNHSKTLESELIRPENVGIYAEDLYHLLKTMHESDSSFLEVYLGTEWGGYATSSPASMPAGFDPRKRGWYSQNLNSGKSSITPAYMTISTQKAVFSAVAPIRNGDGAVKGVAGIDISLDKMTEIVENARLGKTGYIMLVEGTGTILANPADKSTNFKKISELGIDAYDQLAKQKQGHTEVTLGGKELLVTIHTSNELGYKYIGIIDKAEVMAGASSLAKLLLIINFILVGIFCLLGIWIANNIASPLNKMVDMVRDIAEGEGDLTKRLTIDSNDELGALARWFNLFISNLQKIIENIATNAVSIGGSANKLSGISENLLSNSGDTSTRATSVAAASEEMSANLSNVAAAMEQSATNTNMVAAAAEEMNATINKISENAEKARSISSEAVEQARMSSTSMGKLGTAANKIGSVTETITEISEQTNLLALNATIEAARAGDAGKGFAVVANEIKELAKQTAEATLDIKTLVEDVQQTADTTGQGINRITEVIQDVNSTVSSIATAVDEQTATTREIADNISQVSLGIQEVNENVSQSSVVASDITVDITEVSSASQSISENSKEVERNASDLLHNTEELNSIVSKFIVR